VLARVLGSTDVATRKAGVSGAAASMPPLEAFTPLLGWTAIVFLIAAIALAAVTFARRDALAAAVVTLAMLAILPAVASALATVSSHRAVKPLALAVREQWRAGDVLVHEGPLENSGALEWYSGKRPVVVDGRRSVLGFGATRGEAASAFWDAGRLGERWHGSNRVWLVTTRDEARSIVSRLSGARLVAAAGGRRLYVNRTD
jgi:hypothetical protein